MRPIDYARPSSFSRGLRLDLGGVAILLISGTASIDAERRDAARGRFPRADAAARSTTSPACWQPKAPPGRTSCAPPAICATSIATTPRSTKSARRSISEQGLDPLPASTGIQAKLCRPDLLVEIEAIAMFRTGDEGVMHVRAVAASRWSRPALLWAQGTAAVFLRRQSAGPAAESRAAAVRQCAGGHAAVLEVHHALLRELHQAGGIQRRGARRAHGEARRTSTRCASAFWARSRTIRDEQLGKMMLNGAQLAIEEANAARRLRRQAVQADGPQRPGDLGRVQQRNRQDGLRRQGLGHARLDQRRFHAHRAARVAEGRSAHRQQRGHRSHHSGNHHSLVPHHHPGRSRAGLHAGAPHLHRSRA